jgi:ATP-dependent exoDNAse (exonuclease V) beta subunit
MAWLREAYTRRWWTPASSLVEQVIRGRRLFELAMVDRRPRERWQRLRFVLDPARAFADAGGRTLREFLAWAAGQAEEEARVIESVVPEADDDAVRIMTVHAAKGLEFPIVLLAGLNVRRQRPGPPVLWRREGPPELRLHTDVCSAGYEMLRIRDQQLDELEEIRLLYVAATRARDHLLVSVFHETKTAQGRRSAAAQLHASASEVPVLWQSMEAAPAGAAPERAPAAALRLDTPEDREAWRVRRAEAIASRSATRAVSATALAHAGLADAWDDPNLRKDPPAEEHPPWRRGRGGTALGRAVHSVLQTVDLASGEGLEATARAQAAAEGIPGRAAEVARLAQAALDSDAVGGAVASGRFWREIYVGAGIDAPGSDGLVVEGFIDLLYETDEGLVVVDYKTDALLEGDSIEAALSRYRLQGAAYALALSEALRRPVARCVFVFVNASGAIERELPNLSLAIDEARRAAAATQA